MLHHTPSHSPVAYADSKFCGDYDGRWWVDVMFRNKQELDDVIEALVRLREATDFDHVHLQDYNLSASFPHGSAEIVFHKPGKEPESHRADFSRSARAILANLKEGEEQADSGNA